MTNTTPNDDDTALAAEYVMGVLAADDRKDVQARLRRDAAFADQVQSWEDYFSELNEEYGTMHPSPQVKNRIDARLFASAKSPRRWWARAGLAAASLIVAVMIGALALNFGTSPQLVAQLNSDDSTYSFSVAVDARSSALDVTLLAGDLASDRTFELWLIPTEGAPQSLGTFAQSERLPAFVEDPMVTGMVLAVSLEPLGGSPTGAPTGPVLAIGALNDA